MDPDAKPQFEISDDRSVQAMSADLLKNGYQPVFSDWLLPGLGTADLTSGVEQALNG